MVFQDKVYAAAVPHRACGRIVRFRARDGAAGVLVHLIDSTHIQGLAAIRLDLLHQIAIAVVDEAGGQSARCDGDQTVLGVESLVVGGAAFHARNHIAVGVVGIALTGVEGGHRVFVGCVAVRVGRGVLGGDVANGIVVIVVAVGSADRIQPVQFVIGEGQRLAARRIHDLADVAVVLIGIGQVQARRGGRGSTSLQCARVDS